MNENKNIFDLLHDEILESDLSEAEINHRLSALLRAGSRHVNILLVGATGAGKSSTINALFDMSVAKVGIGVDPETKEITKYDLGNVTIWDSPGLGDNAKADKANIKQIVKKLSDIGEDGNLLIDLVLVILDAGSKDLAVSYDVINKTLIPCLGKDNAHRILVGLNQSDMAMKGRHWDHEQNAPNEVLSEFLLMKVDSVKRRIETATGITVTPVHYCAGYTDGETKQNPYNLSKLLYAILMAVPSEKRLVLVDKLNTDEENWESNDDDYNEAIQKSFMESLGEDVLECAEKGAIVGGCIIGIPGVLVGGLVGAIIGGLRGLIVKPLMRVMPNAMK
ncbi:MAG: 50S ribosome-binding GTPase [Defluviitaleaceae bacterium]|nr:50S ribosome-binding GTPase [Defluviitaleaceae bacterium]